MPGVFQNHANLLVKVFAQIALQLCYRLVAEAGNNRPGISFFHAGVKRLFGIHANKRSGRTGTHASGLADEHLLA